MRVYVCAWLVKSVNVGIDRNMNGPSGMCGVTARRPGLHHVGIARKSTIQALEYHR
jgi:hypothetical protein